MKRIILIAALLAFVTLGVNAQVFITKTGFIKFYSSTAAENIEGRNKTVNCAYDVKNNNLVFKVLNKSFEFEKALMQEHFNENYMESDVFPNSNFSGKVTNAKDIDFTKDGVYKVTVEGNMTIHGVTKKLSQAGTFEVKGEKLILKSKFNVKQADYGIKIPAAVAKSFNESMEVTVDISLEKMNIKQK